MDRFDVVVVRNSGPVIHDMAGYEALRAAAREGGVPVFTDLRGKADQVGKQYLLDLFAAGYPVIPTVHDLDHLDRLPAVDELVVKPRFGADSLGLEFVTRDDLATLDLGGRLLQPRIDFAHEISFCFVDRTPQYALYAPDPAARWRLEPYAATPAAGISRSASSNGTTSSTASSAWTRAARGRASCCSSSWRPSTPTSRSTSSTRPPGRRSSRA